MMIADADISAPVVAALPSAIHPHMGSEILGLDLTVSPRDAAIRLIRRALDETSLVLLRGQRLTPEEQVALTEALGLVVMHPLASARWPEAPAIVIECHTRQPKAEVSGQADGAEFWHSDLAYESQPNKISILHAIEVPGDESRLVTCFADRAAALDELDPWLAHRIEFLDGEHDPGLLETVSTGDRTGAALLPAVTHPLVRIDPTTRRRSLFVDERTTAGIPALPRIEAEQTLHRLREQSNDPSVAYRHVWRPGDVLIWENLALLHRHEHTSAPWRLHRTMVAGDRPVGPASVTVPWVIAG